MFKNLFQKIFGFVKDEFGETFLFVEQEAHLSEYCEAAYYVVTTISCANGYEQRMKCAIPLMEHLLSGYTVLTYMYVGRRQKDAMKMCAKFCTDYAENAAKNPIGGEKVYINGEGGMLTITKGMNRKLAEAIMNKPEIDDSVGYLPSAFEEAPEQERIVDYQSAWRFFQKEAIIQARYPGVGCGILVGVSSTEGAEAWLVEKLLAFAKMYGTKIDFCWPEALAVAQALDASVLANRITFVKSLYHKK